MKKLTHAGIVTVSGLVLVPIMSSLFTTGDTSALPPLVAGAGPLLLVLTGNGATSPCSRIL